MPSPHEAATRNARLVAKLIDVLPPFVLQGASAVPLWKYVQTVMTNEHVQQALRTAQTTPTQLQQSPLVGQFASYSLSLSGIVLIYWSVQAVFLTKDGQTIGKKVTKIRIVNENTGENGGFVPNVLLRAIVNALLSLIPFYALIDILFIFRKDRRCIHDFIAGTVVVNQ